MMRRFAAACVAAGVSVTLFLSSAAGAFAESSAGSTSSGTAGAASTVSEAGTAALETAASESGAALSKEQPSSGLPELPFDLDSVLSDEQLQELTKNLDAIIALLSSEELQSLLKYEEVQDLLVTIIDKAMSFTQEEPELFAKILNALDLDETYVKLIMSALSVLQKARNNLEAYLESGEGQQLQGAVRSILDKPEIVNRLTALSEILEKYYKAASSAVQGTEQTASEAEQTASGEEGPSSGAEQIASGAEQTSSGEEEPSSGAEQTASEAELLDGGATQK